MNLEDAKAKARALGKAAKERAIIGSQAVRKKAKIAREQASAYAAEKKKDFCACDKEAKKP